MVGKGNNIVNYHVNCTMEQDLSFNEFRKMTQIACHTSILVNTK